LKLYGRWKVTLPGEEYVWEPDDTTVNEELLLEGEHGMTFEEWVEAVDERRAVPCQVLIWYLRRKADPTYQVERMAVDFPIRRLATEEIEAPAVVPPTQAEPVESGPATSSTSPDTGSDPGSGATLVAVTS
jgi:hypothetical protein